VRMWVGSRLSALSTLLVLSLATAAPQAAPGERQAKPAARSQADASMVRISVMVRDHKSDDPLATLKQTDFVLQDNGHPVEISTFQAGLGARSLALWLTVVCSEKGLGDHGSQSFAGKESLLRPAMNQLSANDRVAVAHWCDDGNMGIDLPPSLDRDNAVAALQNALRPLDFKQPPAGQERPGQLAFERMIEFIVRDAEGAPDHPVPVIVFLNSDWMFLPVEELNGLADDIEYSSGFAYGMKSNDVPDYPIELAYQQRGSYRMIEGQAPKALHYLSWRAGGGYYSVKPDSYAEALRNLILTVRSRYELGFYPPLSKDNRHEVEVKLAKDSPYAKSADLEFRPHYPFIHQVEAVASAQGGGETQKGPPQVPNYMEGALPTLEDALPELRGIKPSGDSAGLPLALARVGDVTENLARRLPNLLAHEEVIQKQIRGIAKRKGQARQEFDYLILAHPGREAVSLEEYRSEETDRPKKRAAAQDYPLTQGFITIWVRFYPANQPQSSFRYLGEQKVSGEKTWVIAFAEKPEAAKFPGKIQLEGSEFSVFYQGVAWIDETTFRIVRIHTDLLKPLPEARLQALSTTVDFGAAHITESNSIFWLPRSATVRLDWDRRVFENVHKYSGYRLYKAKARIVIP
jgi:hypothetical protein